MCPNERGYGILLYTYMMYVFVRMHVCVSSTLSFLYMQQNYVNKTDDIIVFYIYAEWHALTYLSFVPLVVELPFLYILSFIECKKYDIQHRNKLIKLRWLWLLMIKLSAIKLKLLAWYFIDSSIGGYKTRTSDHGNGSTNPR